MASQYKDNCDGCSRDYDMTAKNTELHIYIDTPRFNFAVTICPHCKFTTRIFSEPDPIVDMISQAFRLFVGVVAPEEIQTAKNELDGIPAPVIPVPQELTARQQKVLDNLRNCLQAMPDRDLLAELELPAPPHKMPERWSDD